MSGSPSLRRQHLLAAAALLAATLCCFHRLALTPDGVLVGPQQGGRNDLTASIIPSRGFPRHAVADSGGVPLWNPYELGGIPWLGNPQSAMLYPPNWLYLLFDATWLAGWLMALHLWAGGLGVYAYCRRLGLAWGPAVLAGCGFLGAPYLIANVGEGHYNPVCVMAWLPWALVGYEWLREGRPRGVPLLAFVFAMGFFCGHVQELFYFVLILTCWVLVDGLLSARRAGADPAARLVGWWVLVGLATVGLVCVELIPIYAYTAQAVRSGGISVDEAARASLGVRSLLQLVDPFALGGPGDYRGPILYWETVCHFGLGLTLLALVGTLGGWRHTAVRRLSLTAALCLLFAAGTATPLFPAVFRFVPGVSYFRAPSRVLFLASLFVSVLAAFGAHVLTRRAADQLAGLRHRRAAEFAAAVLAVLLLAASLAGSRPGSDWAVDWRWNPLAVGLGAGGFLLVMATSAARPSRAGVAVALAILLVTAESSAHSHRVLRVVPRHDFRTDSPVVRFLDDRLGTARVLADQALLSDCEAWWHGLGKLHGYEPVPPVRSALLIAAAVEGVAPPNELTGFNPVYPARYRQNVLDLAGVRYAVVPAEGPRPAANWRQVHVGEVRPAVQPSGSPGRPRRYEIWENETVMPRAFVLGRVLPAHPAGRLTDQLAGLDPRESVLVPRDVLPAGPRQAFRPARIVEYSPQRVEVEAELDAPGYLVLTDVFASGWRASVDGRPVPVMPADGVFRGVPLGPGRHRVTFTFRPPGLAMGALVSALTVVSLLVSLRPPRADARPIGAQPGCEPRLESTAATACESVAAPL